MSTAIFCRQLAENLNGGVGVSTSDISSIQEQSIRHYEDGFLNFCINCPALLHFQAK